MTKKRTKNANRRPFNAVVRNRIQEQIERCSRDIHNAFETKNTGMMHALEWKKLGLEEALISVEKK